MKILITHISSYMTHHTIGKELRGIWPGQIYDLRLAFLSVLFITVTLSLELMNVTMNGLLTSFVMDKVSYVKEWD